MGAGIQRCAHRSPDSQSRAGPQLAADNAFGSLFRPLLKGDTLARRMAVFEQGAEQRERLDWRLLYNSPITLYFSNEVLTRDLSWFAGAGYKVLSLDTASVSSLEALLTGLGKVFSFPDYYGRNLDALNDCLSDVEIPDIGGLVLVLRDFDRFAAISPEAAHAILDICADNSRRFLMTGRRFVVLVHSSDPRISFPPVGASSVLWNPQEWLDAKRGL